MDYSEPGDLDYKALVSGTVRVPIKGHRPSPQFRRWSCRRWLLAMIMIGDFVAMAVLVMSVVRQCVVMLVLTMTTVPNHCLPHHRTHARTHTHTRAPRSIHATHTPPGPLTCSRFRASGTYPCWIEAGRKPRESCVPDPAHTNSVRLPTLRHEQPVAWGHHWHGCRRRRSSNHLGKTAPKVTVQQGIHLPSSGACSLHPLIQAQLLASQLVE